MGPHSFECGNWCLWQAEIPAKRRFNGAALVRVRKWVTTIGSRSLQIRLQWGRTRSSAEIVWLCPGYR